MYWKKRFNSWTRKCCCSKKPELEQSPFKSESNSILITNVNVIRLTESDSTGINDDKGSGQNKD